MGTIKSFTFTTFYGDMLPLLDSFWVFLSKFLVFVFGSFLTYIPSFKGIDNCYEKIESCCCYKGSKIEEFNQKEKALQVLEFDRECVDNKTPEEEEEEKIENNSIVVMASSSSSSSASKYQFMSEKHISGFLEKPQVLSFAIQELYLGSGNSTGEVLDLVKTEDSVVVVDKVSNEKQEGETFTEETTVFTEFKFLRNYDSFSEVPKLDTSTDDDCKSVSEELRIESFEGIKKEKVKEFERVLDQSTSFMSDQTTDDCDSDDEYIELELESRSSSVFDEEIWSIEDLIQPAEEEDISEEPQLENEAEEEDLVYKVTSSVDGLVKESELEEIEFISDYDDDHEEEEEEEDDDDDDFEFGHNELIEQLKMELKMARTGGLPTILEESESPKIVEELKPLKIEKKFEHKDRLLEIHKFYRSYLDKMRKLDVLNSQTMHTIGLLQLKERGELIRTQKPSVPAIKNLLTQNLFSFKQRRREENPTLKFIEELKKEFELVYVGQVCLSWEILNWQFTKALELQEYDCQQFRQYNEVAGEYQRFQVLLQRFVEDEPFQGLPRVQNYVNSRCVDHHCSLLQVPVIKDDKNARRRNGEDAITSRMLTEIIEESMRLFWEFLCADKFEADAILKGTEVHDYVDSELLADIRTDFQKKEKRLKEILRSGGCIVRRFQKHQENQRLHRVLFFAQVEMKLVSRVLSMSKLTTDQLIWCHEKLDKINFCNRKLVLEPSFLLFPF